MTKSWLRELLSSVLSLLPARQNLRHSELAQALLRLLLGLGTAFYIWVGVSTGYLANELGGVLRTYTYLFLVVSLCLFAWILFRPGVFTLRRVAAMALDYGSLTFAMVIGEQYGTPIFALLVWITIGYGVRYGQAYLVVGTSLALLSVAVLAGFSTYWSENIFLIVTMVITVIIVPLYAFSLLNSIRQARDVAIAATKAKSHFLAQASHDLRQPVHAISLFTACLRDSGLNADQGQMVNNIDRSLTSVMRLFRSLLDVSTLDSGKVRPRSEPVFMGGLLAEIVSQNEETARSNGVDLRVVRSSQAFLGDAGLMTTIVQNLVTNAIKYAPGAKVIVGCRRRADGEFAVWVSDNGPGISDQEQSRVFEEFYRSMAHGQDIEGVGLGLPIVKRMAEIMGYRVVLRSCSGRGTTVSIEGLRHIAASPKPSPKVDSRQVTGLLKGMRILLIEDNADVLLATQTMLERWGCIVQAGQFFPDDVQPCDLIITDYDLNGPLTGAECISRIRQVELRHVPAIIITGHDVARIETHLDDPTIPILSKPLQPAALRQLLMTHRMNSEAPPPVH